MKDYIEIIETVRKSMSYANSHNWEGLLNEVFADEVTQDDSSYPGAPEAYTMSAVAKIEQWKTAFTSFKHTHHQMGNELVSINDDAATVLGHVIAHHCKNDNSIWTVISTFDYQLKKISRGWRLTHLTQHFKFEIGSPVSPY